MRHGGNVAANKGDLGWSVPLRVTFWWRDPQGDATHYATRRVWIYITGITDHHNLSAPQSMKRLADTDAWFWETELPGNWRGSYCFIPSPYENDFPDGAFCSSGADPAALRIGWSALFPRAIADPLNPCAWSGGRGHPSSALHLPDAPRQPGWESTCTAYPPPIALDWFSTRLGNQRCVWVFTLGEVRPSQRPLSILLDGQFWAKSMPVWPALATLTQQGHLPPAVYVLIDAIDHTYRSRELPCNPAFWQAVIDELFPQIGALTSWNHDPATTVVTGQSFGGLAALYAALSAAVWLCA